ncbi:sulfate transporter family-domain-containing protein [Zychaea mexicana]|uniref:sulfate transporter family-domain-containing protein n=1 Tax=Zychaea mexicana TaxID=64656 RepID=UPI0022FE32C5|nr:sulfate transporter family-domain-containing protein [Zychaea mexicana]KAI9490875.1 sulfate transporter family-domain-containing protein [Zychaea mexicana]
MPTIPKTFVDNPPEDYMDNIRSRARQLPRSVRSYFSQLCPIVSWLPKYNLVWLSSDIISGLTVGCIVVPQSMAYAKLVGLPAQYGLYTSFVGCALYPLIGTSKDINIGTTAIQALFLGQVFATVQETPQYQSGLWTDHQFAITMSFFAGIITLGLSLLQLGILFNFICQPAVSGFMAGSAVTIIISQLGKILGIHVNTNEAPYLIFGYTLKDLPHTKVDAIFGILSLVWLYGVKYACKHLAKRYPHHKRKILYFSTSRNILVLCFTTILSWMINHIGQYAESPFAILGPVPPGFQEMGVPQLDASLAAHVLPNFPSMVVLLIMEHCSIATSLGKSSDYRININQEILSLGLTNVFGSFFSAFPATGSFCRSAVASKSGAKTPLNNTVVAIVVILALYALTPAFQFIPTSSLAAVIAHAVSDLVVGPSVWRRFWSVHPSEFLIFTCAFIISLFARLDISIYVAVIISIAVQLYRSARPNYAVLGRMDTLHTSDSKTCEKTSSPASSASPSKSTRAEDELDALAHSKFFSFTHPMLGQYAKPIAPGVTAFQPRDNLVFENSLFLTEKLLDEIKRTTRRGKPLAEKVGDRPWNNAGGVSKTMNRPLLHSVIMDLTGVHQMDYSGIEDLKAAANQAERYSGRPVSWFFVLNDSLAVRKCLLFGGFGNQERKPGGPFRSDLRKRSDEDNGYKDSDANDDDRSSSSIDGGSIASDGTNKELQVVEIEDTRKPSKKDESIVSYDNICVLDDNMGHCTISELDDVYPYFFFTMRDAAVAACSRHAGPEEHALPSSISSIKADASNMNEEKNIEKQ